MLVKSATTSLLVQLVTVWRVNPGFMSTGTMPPNRPTTCLGWKAIYHGGQNGRWSVCAASCGQTVVAIADTREEAWSAACSTAFNVMRERREGRS